MKKAFTMMELIFVIVVIGILAAIIMPRVGSNKLQEAAIQVVSHIRYTQHLAMVDDKFDEAPNADLWFEKRWQIFFANTDGSAESWAYTIYSDYTNHDGVPNVNEIADNPLNNGKKLTGGYSAGTIAYNDSDATNELNIGKKYGVTGVDFSANCEVNSLRISFDHLGRPLYDGPHLLDETYRDGSSSRLIQYDGGGNPCIITMTSSEGSIEIAIEPETGYAHIL